MTNDNPNDWQAKELDQIMRDVREIYDHLTRPDGSLENPIVAAKVAAVIQQIPHTVIERASPLPVPPEPIPEQPRASWSDNAAVQSGIENMVPYEMRDLVYRVLGAVEHNPKKLALAIIIAVTIAIATGQISVPKSVKDTVAGFCPAPAVPTVPLQLPAQHVPTMPQQVPVNGNVVPSVPVQSVPQPQ